MLEMQYLSAQAMVTARTTRNRPEVRADALSSIWIVADRYPHLNASEIAEQAIWEANALHRNSDSVVDPDTLDQMPAVVRGHDDDDDEHADRRSLRADELVGIALEHLGPRACALISDGMTPGQAADALTVTDDGTGMCRAWFWRLLKRARSAAVIEQVGFDGS